MISWKIFLIEKSFRISLTFIQKSAIISLSTEYKNTMKYLIKIDSFSAEEESYEEGCTGVIYDDTWDGETEFFAENKQDILCQLSELLSIDYKDLEIYKMDNKYINNMFYVTYPMNEMYMTPSDEEVELWKKNEKTLYLANFYFYIYEIKEVEILSELA